MEPSGQNRLRWIILTHLASPGNANLVESGPCGLVMLRSGSEKGDFDQSVYFDHVGPVWSSTASGSTTATAHGGG